MRGVAVTARRKRPFRPPSANVTLPKPNPRAEPTLILQRINTTVDNAVGSVGLLLDSLSYDQVRTCPQVANASMSD